MNDIPYYFYRKCSLQYTTRCASDPSKIKDFTDESVKMVTGIPRIDDIVACKVCWKQHYDMETTRRMDRTPYARHILTTLNNGFGITTDAVIDMIWETHSIKIEPKCPMCDSDHPDHCFNTEFVYPSGPPSGSSEDPSEGETILWETVIFEIEDPLGSPEEEEINKELSQFLDKIHRYKGPPEEYYSSLVYHGVHPSVVYSINGRSYNVWDMCIGKSALVINLIENGCKIPTTFFKGNVRDYVHRLEIVLPLLCDNEHLVSTFIETCIHDGLRDVRNIFIERFFSYIFTYQPHFRETIAIQLLEYGASTNTLIHGRNHFGLHRLKIGYMFFHPGRDNYVNYTHCTVPFTRIMLLNIDRNLIPFYSPNVSAKIGESVINFFTLKRMMIKKAWENNLDLSLLPPIFQQI